MRFPPQFLDELRARLPVSEVVRQRVQLKKQGKEWRGLSPFNKEKTPSFYVNDQKGFYHDFSSGKHGDIFSFVIETEGLTFPEAVERLASLAGLAVPKLSREAEEQEQKRKSLHDVLEIATVFFEKTLASAKGAKARGYLADRGIKSATQLEFRIGYATADRYALKEYLGSQGVSVTDMIEVGLLVAGDEIPVPYDRFRDRVIIPIHDQRGRVIGFGGRTLNPEGQPKYLNSPETSLFHKGSTVFNFHRARQPAHDDGSVVVVEGYMDAISIYQAGLKSVVASMGTAFTEEQIQTLWRLSDEPIVCFDADRAGISAAHRSIDRILPMLAVGHTFRFAFIQSGKDPDELIRDKGLDAFKDVLLGSLPLWDVLWERETSNSAARFDTPDARAALEHRLNSIIKTIKDSTVQTAYYRTCRIELSEFFWHATKGHRGGTSIPKDGLLKKELKIKIEKEGHRHELQKMLLGTLIQYPELLDGKEEAVSSISFDGKLDTFRRALFELLIDHGDVSVELIYKRLSPIYYEVLNDLHGERTDIRPRGHRLFSRFPTLAWDPPISFVSRCVDHFIHVLKLEQLKDDLSRLNNNLSQATDDLERITLQIISLRKEIDKEKGQGDANDIALAEEATEIRRLGRRIPALLPSASPVPEFA
jgi:DNA primase